MPTVKQEWLLILVVSVLMMACLGIDAWHFPRETARGDHTPLSFVAGLLHMFGAGLWITMDRTRRG
ncbi:MAG TPA: hypothetical protein VG457_15785, partial [Planctomycetota bacterium]|nr:hypothetical protein [Planctomycetota bacterium]